MTISDDLRMLLTGPRRQIGEINLLRIAGADVLRLGKPAFVDEYS